MNRRPLAEHRTAVAEHLAGLGGTETIATGDALHRVTAAPVEAPFSLPLFDNSAMDGYAVRAGDVSVGTTLPVAGRIFAGDPRARLSPRTAMAIMTGAPLPTGADAVIPVEISHEKDGSVRFDAGTRSGTAVRPAGDDVSAGDLIIDEGVLLAPRHLGALAASGVAHLEVHRRPTVAVVSTGSELVAPGTQPSDGQIFESNSLVLSGLVADNGGDVVFTGTAGDDGDFEDVLNRACENADVVLTSGGISMGEREPVRQLLGDHGWFGPVAVQPGGPQGLATWNGTPVCCFPGNPVSVLVSFEVLVRNVLRRAAGLDEIVAAPRRLAVEVTSTAGKTRFLRGLGSGDEVTTVGGPGSHLAAAAAGADVLIEIDAAVADAPAGMEVPTWPMT